MERASTTAVMFPTITPFTAQIDALRESLPQNVVTYLDKSYAELRGHRDGLGTYVRENPRG